MVLEYLVLEYMIHGTWYLGCDGYLVCQVEEKWFCPRLTLHNSHLINMSSAHYCSFSFDLTASLLNKSVE